MVRFLCVSAVLAAGLILGGEVWPQFVDLPSLLITVGGTLVVTLLSFSGAEIGALVGALHGLFTAERRTPEEHLSELRRLTRLYRLQGPRGLENQEQTVTDPFLRQGIGMLIDLRKETEIREALDGALLQLAARNGAARRILLTMARLLPAFGLIGTLIGMVLLLGGGLNEDVQALPPALSVAVLTTLYGAFLANVVVHPLAAKLQFFEQEAETMMRLTLEWTLALARGESLEPFEKRLGRLLPSDEAGQGRERGWERPLLSTEG